MKELGRVAIVGAGQVGTMLGMALRGAGGVSEVTLWDRSPEVAAESLAGGGGDRVLGSVEEAFETEVLLLAMPVPEIVAFLRSRGESIRPGTLVLDTGSAKADVVAAMRDLPEGVQAVGGHPIAGTETPGPVGAVPALLQRAAFVLVDARADPGAMRRARAVVEAMGARPVEMDAAAHDRALARTSHLAHLVAFALAEVGGGEPDLGSSGFAGATRLAASDPAMTAGFLSANAAEVRAAAGDLREALGRLLDALDGDGEALAAALERARRR